MSFYTELELQKKHYKELKSEFDAVMKLIEDVKVELKAKDDYIKELTEDKKRLTYLNVILVVSLLITITISLIFLVKSQ